MGESRTLARKRGIGERAWREKGGLQSEGKQILRRKGRARKKSLPKGSKRRYERMTQRLSRTICRVMVSLQVWPNLKPERRLGDEEPAHERKG